jgi:DNA uptake protein ComE-like DNA-binding protein
LNKVSKEQSEWLANQTAIDSLKLEGKNYKPAIHPFNPNFISDFKGYKLGMSVDEIDRLLAFRKQNKFVNSAAEFQAVTKVSDSLLHAISPYLNFPYWLKNKKNSFRPFGKKEFPSPEKITVLDINEATKEDLMKVYGIGDKISDRILEQKQKLGAFVSMKQMNDIWGLSDEVIEKLNASFVVKSTANAKKVNINNASVRELTQFPFFKYQLAKDIVVYRTMNGDIKMEDLSKIKGFPVEKIEIIALYLEF